MILANAILFLERAKYIQETLRIFEFSEND